MKKRKLLIILVVCILINISLTTIIIIPSYNILKERGHNNEFEEKELRIEDDVKEPIVKVDLKDDLSVPFFSKVKVSDFVTNINGEIVDNYAIDTTSLGEKEINFEYINEESIKVPYSFKINIKDVVAPSIWLGDTYSIKTDYKGSLLEDITCADDYDDNPKCEIIGKYDTKKVGKYNLTYKATDASGNTTTKKFTLNVTEPTPKKPSSNTKPTYNYLSDIIDDYKTSKTKIGIDISSWQGDIDFEKVKDAGVEFVFIRVGSTKGINGEYFVDKTFKRNIEGFNRVGIPVGIYFYSYANSTSSAIADAKWVLDQISGYKIDLQIAYDWESWSFYNEFHQSFYSTTKNAKAFLDTIKAAGYEGILYSSKNYLEKVWYETGYETWLAHYTEKTTYKGDYRYWQLCSNGKVDGINSRVDINIMYL